MSADRRATTRKGLLTVGTALLMALSISLLVDRAGLRYLQGVLWPEDLTAFTMRKQPRLDVVVLGSSRASFGLSPSALSLCLEQSTQRPVQVVNLATPFATASSSWATLRYLIREQHQPEVILLGVGPELMNSQHPKAALTLAQHSSLSDLPRSLLRAGDLDEAFAALSPLTRGVETLSLFLAQRHHSQERLRWMMTHYGGGQFCFEGPECDEENRRYETLLGQRWDMVVQNELPRLGEERFGDYQASEGPVTEDMSALLRWTREVGAELVLVDLPMHQIFLDALPPEVLPRYESRLSELEQQEGVTLRRYPEQRWTQRRELFLDPDHLNARGSQLLSQRVCRDPLTPLLRD